MSYDKKNTARGTFVFGRQMRFGVDCYLSQIFRGGILADNVPSQIDCNGVLGARGTFYTVQLVETTRTQIPME